MYGLIENLFSGLRSRRLRRETIRQLSSLSDHALKDIGLDRSEIRSLAEELTRRGDRSRVKTVQSTRPSVAPITATQHGTDATLHRKAA